MVTELVSWVLLLCLFAKTLQSSQRAVDFNRHIVDFRNQAQLD